MVSSVGYLVALTSFIALLFAAVMNRDIVPEPVTLLMLGAGLVGVAGVMRRNLSNRANSAEE